MLAMIQPYVINRYLFLSLALRLEEHGADRTSMLQEYSPRMVLEHQQSPTHFQMALVVWQLTLKM